MNVSAHRFDNAKRRRPDGHDRQRMLTPPYVLEPIREVLGGIGLDPCTEYDNPTKADKFYCLPQDGATLPWKSHSVFCNPPYGEARNRWIERSIEEGKNRSVVLLIPSHTETKSFQLCLSECEGVIFVKSRLKFGVVRKNGIEEAASHGSAIFGFGCDVSPLNTLGVWMK